jgi:hypothetical protein
MDSCAASTACPLLSAAALLAFSDSDAILPYSRKTKKKLLLALQNFFFLAIFLQKSLRLLQIYVNYFSQNTSVEDL